MNLKVYLKIICIAAIGFSVSSMFLVTARSKIVTIEFPNEATIIDKDGRLTQSVGTRVIFSNTNTDFEILVTNGTHVPVSGVSGTMCPGGAPITLYRGTNLLCADNQALPTYKFWSEAEYPNTMWTLEYRVEVDRRGKIKLSAQGFDALHRRVELKWKKEEKQLN